MITKRQVLKLALVFTGAVICSLLYYGWEKPHITTTRYEIQCRGNGTSCGSILALTPNNYLVDASFASYHKAVYFSGDTTEIKGVSVYNNHQEPVYIPVSRFIPADTTITGHTTIPLSGKQKALYTIPAEGQRKPSIIPFARKLVNWGGDMPLLKRAVFNLFTMAVLLLLAIAVMLRPWLEQLYSHSPGRIPVTAYPRYALPLQLLLFVAAFTMLLLMHPYYFLHDDNYAQFQPVIVFSMDEFYQTGQLPVYNPYQFAGMPTLPSSIYSLLYPGTHISYLFSRFVLGDAVHFTTVFCFIHFLCGYYFFCRLLKKLQVPFGYATIAAVCFVFSGFVVTLCGSWYYAAPSVAFLPLLAWLCVCPPRRRLVEWGWFILVFTLYAYSGNLQFCVYAFCFWAVFMLLRATARVQAMVTVLVTGLGMVLLYLPQAIVSFPVINSLQRTSLSYENAFPYLQNFMFPVERQVNGLFRPNNLYWQHEMSFYNLHFLFLLAAFLLPVWVFLFMKKTSTLPRTFIILLLLFAAAVLFSLGKAGLLWPVTAKLPLFSKFQHPFKFLLFIIFFGSMAGVLFFTWLRGVYLRNVLALRLIHAGVYGFGVMALLFTFIFCQQHFNRYGFRKPYAAEPWMRHILREKDYRVYAAGASTAPGRSASLMFNFGTVYKIPSAGGWEELNGIYPNVLQYGRQYGVRYYILSEFQDYREGLNIRSETEFPLWLKKSEESLPVIYRDSSIRIYEDVNAEPLVQLRQQGVLQPVDFDIRYNARGATISLNKEVTGDGLTLAFIWRPKLNVYLDGKQHAVEKDEFQRVWVRPSGSFSKIELLYEPYR